MVKLSAMHLLCCVALSFYSCCFSKEFKIWTSHIVTLTSLIFSLGISIALDPDIYAFIMVGAACVMIWVSFVIMNTASFIKFLQRDMSFYAALTVQTDLSMLVIVHCLSRFKSGMAKDSKKNNEEKKSR